MKTTENQNGASLKRVVRRLPHRRRQAIRQAVIARDSVLINGVRTARCMWCGKEVGGENLTIEHIKPLRDGGTYEMNNLGIACKRCNIGRMN